MPNHEEIDVESQLQGLFQEAEDNLATAKSAKGGKSAVQQAEEKAVRAFLSLPQMLRPVLLGLEALGRASGEHSTLLGKLEAKVDKVAENPSEVQKALPPLVEGLRSMLDQKNGVNQRMFDALHEELKSYKDGFLLESVQKPVICDLISHYDELSVVLRQMEEVLCEAVMMPEAGAGALVERLKRMETNLMHNREFIVEVLARLEVSMLPTGAGKLDKQNQRVISVEPTDEPREEGDIVQICKCGFFWRGRVLRPEEVVIKKCRQNGQGIASALHSHP